MFLTIFNFAKISSEKALKLHLTFIYFFFASQVDTAMTYDDGVLTIRYGSKQVEFVMWDLSGKQLNSLIHKFVSPYHLFHKNEMKIKFFYPIISLLIYMQVVRSTMG